MPTRRKTSRSGRLLLLAAAASLVLFYIPYAEVVVYPFRIFVTFIHETSHALAAWASGGAVGYIRIYSTGDGVTLTQGGAPLLISSAGYIGSVGYGATLLRICRRPILAKPALGFTAVVIATTTVLLLQPTGFGILAGAGLTILLVLIAAIFSQATALFFTAFLAIECCLNALFDLKTLLLLSARTSVYTDALSMQQATGLPALFWALVWSVLSLIILAMSIRGVLPNYQGR